MHPLMNNTMIEALGAIGSFAFAVSGLPQAILSFRQKHSRGISGWLLFLWLVGELFTLLYVLLKFSDLWLLINYTLNLFFVSVITYYWFFPSQHNK